MARRPRERGRVDVDMVSATASSGSGRRVDAAIVIEEASGVDGTAGQAGKAGYYVDHPDYDGEEDRAELISRLSAEYDAWALSTSAAALQDVLELGPPG